MTSTTNIAIGIFAGGLLLFGAYSCVQQSEETDKILADLDRNAALSNSINPKFVGWKYSTEIDAMRGTKTKRADLLAEDYDASTTPTLSVWRKPDGTKGAMVAGAMTELGNIQCDPSTGTIAVKADSNPVQNLRCQMGMSIAVEPKLFDLVKASKHLIIEVGDGYGGVRQFTFKTEGLSL